MTLAGSISFWMNGIHALMSTPAMSKMLMMAGVSNL
jgi:hypothetical protein